MRSLFDAVRGRARQNGAAHAISDPKSSLSRSELLARVSFLAGEIDPGARVVGILAPNGIDWAIALLACAMAGKIVVPLPTFFSAVQLAHIARDASIDAVLATRETWPRVLEAGVTPRLIEGGRTHTGSPVGIDDVFREGFGQIIYTSGSTGEPKGVRLE